MIRADKLQASLLALNAVLVGARSMAYERASHVDLAHVLDVAEYLPMLMLDGRQDDCTAQFRGELVGLAERFSDFGFAAAVQRFDDKT